MNLFSYLAESANWVGNDGIVWRLAQHLFYTVLTLVIASLIAIPLGVVVGHTGRGNFLVIGSSNALRALPTLGFLVLAVLLLGTGLVPIMIPLVVLAVPPILTATAAGVRGADPDAVHAGRALGMTPLQLIMQVELPLALPLISSGLRSATLQVVATATVAAYATAGGLGRLVIDGQKAGEAGYPQMFAGALLVAVLAIVLDVIIAALGRGLSSRSRPRRRRRTPRPELVS